MTVVLAIAAAAAAPLAALLAYWLAWRPRLGVEPGAAQRMATIRGVVSEPAADPGAGVAANEADEADSAVVFELDALGNATVSRPFVVRAGAQRAHVVPADAQLEARARPGRGRDVRLGDTVSVDGLLAADNGSSADRALRVDATRIIRAGWPRGGLVIACAVIAGAVGAAAGVVTLRAGDGCPEGLRRVRRRMPLSEEYRCVGADGRADGPAQKYDYTGKLRAFGRYKDGVKHGRWVRLYRSGKRREITEYRRGIKHGLWARYDHAGRLRSRAKLDDGSGPWRGFHKNGKRAGEGRYRRERKHGRWLLRHDNGKRSFLTTYAAGVKHGPAKRWHRNGYPAEAGSYARGKRAGAWTFFREDGTKEKSGPFARGKKHGDWTFWRSDGSKEHAGRFVRGVKEGHWTFWDKHGKPVVDGSYRRGSRVGKWRWWCARCKDCTTCKGKAADAVVEKDYGARRLGAVRRAPVGADVGTARRVGKRTSSTLPRRQTRN